jgi:hypothetical protein
MNIIIVKDVEISPEYALTILGKAKIFEEKFWSFTIRIKSNQVIKTFSNQFDYLWKKYNLKDKL